MPFKGKRFSFMSKKHQKDMQELQENEESLESNILSENSEQESDKQADNIQPLLQEIAEQKDKYMRLLAEFENFKRRTSKEKTEYIRLAGQETIKDLLPALDDIDRATALNSEAKDIESVRQGLTLIAEKIKNILASKGLKEMETNAQDFDADTMESLSEMPASDESMKGKVLETISKGYTLNDKIIRYAKVVVGK